MLLFLKLLLAHLIGDFLLQWDKFVWDKEKKKIYSPYLYLHICIHALLLALLLEFDRHYWLGFILIIVSHYIIDLWKIYFQNENNRKFLFLIDQSLHLMVILLVTYLYQDIELNLEKILTAELLLLFVFLILIGSVSSTLIKIIISKWDPVMQARNNASLAKAGAFIGMLERLFVFIFIISDHWEAVGFLLAAKSVFRYGDLKEAHNRKMTEYILIGTLLSFGMAILAGMAYLYILKNVSA